MLTRIAFMFALSLAVLASGARAGTWTLDKDHTEVRVTWDHLGLSRQGARFRDIEGTLAFDPERPGEARVEVTIPMKSLSTGVAKLDEHLLKTKDFFDVAAHPAITFKSTAVTVKSDRTLDVAGDLTINGVTHPVVLDVIWNFSGDHPMANINPTYQGVQASGFSAKTQIRRSDWGIKRTIPYVSDELSIVIETEALRQAPVPPAPASGQPGDPAAAAIGTAEEPARAPVDTPEVAGPSGASPVPVPVPADGGPVGAVPVPGTAVEMEPLPPPPGAAAP